MADDERISIDERRKYLKLLARRYAKAGRVERSGLLTEIEAVTGLHRKSVQRLLRRFRRDSPQLPRRRPQAGNALLREVPMEWLSWAIDCPGTFETDLVHRSGPAPEGECVHTLQMIDIATGWSGRVAVPGRSQAAMVEGEEMAGLRLSRSRPFHFHRRDNRNLFQPVLHLIGKEMIAGKLRRRWDRARTPYQRLL